MWWCLWIWLRVDVGYQIMLKINDTPCEKWYSYQALLGACHWVVDIHYHSTCACHAIFTEVSKPPTKLTTTMFELQQESASTPSDRSTHSIVNSNRIWYKWSMWLEQYYSDVPWKQSRVNDEAYQTVSDKQWEGKVQQTNKLLTIASNIIVRPVNSVSDSNLTIYFYLCPYS